MDYNTRYAHSSDCAVKWFKYRNGRKGFSIIDEKTGETVSVCSVNLADHRIADDCVAIKDYSENEGCLDECIRLGIVGKPLYKVASGFVEIPVCKVLK